MTKNTNTKTVCKAGTQEEKRSSVSFKTKKPGQAKKVAANSPIAPTSPVVGVM